MKRINHRNVKKIMWPIFAVGALLPVVFKMSDVAVLLGVLLIGLAIGLYFLYWRCPHCGRDLGRDGGAFCPHCGKQIK